MVFLIWLAILPSIRLARHVLSYDKIEKEPAGLLIKLFVFGMLTCVPAAFIESMGEGLITSVTENPAIISAFVYLLLVPFAEEGCKYVALRTTRKNPAFNYTFDGIVYGVMVGLGFATLENILYVLDNMSLSVAVMRGLLAVPMHCTCGVFMGYYYGVAKNLEVRGIKGEAATARRLTLAVPWVIHGLYDYALDLDSWVVLILGLMMTIAVFVLAARQGRIASANDQPILVMPPETPPLLRSLFTGEAEQPQLSKGRPVPPYHK